METTPLKHPKFNRIDLSWLNDMDYRRLLLIPFASYFVGDLAFSVSKEISFWLRFIPWNSANLTFLSPLTSGVPLQTFILLGYFIEPKERISAAFILGTYYYITHFEELLTYAPYRPAVCPGMCEVIVPNPVPWLTPLLVCTYVVLLNIFFAVSLRQSSLPGTTSAFQSMRFAWPSVDLVRTLLVVPLATLASECGNYLVNVFAEPFYSFLVRCLLLLNLGDLCEYLSVFIKIPFMVAFIVFGLFISPKEKWKTARVLILYSAVVSISLMQRLWGTMPLLLLVFQALLIFLSLYISWKICRKRYGPQVSPIAA